MRVAPGLLESSAFAPNKSTTFSEVTLLLEANARRCAQATGACLASMRGRGPSTLGRVALDLQQTIRRPTPGTCNPPWHPCHRPHARPVKAKVGSTNFKLRSRSTTDLPTPGLGVAALSMPPACVYLSDECRLCSRGEYAQESTRQPAASGADCSHKCAGLCCTSVGWLCGQSMLPHATRKRSLALRTRPSFSNSNTGSLGPEL